jgi:PKD repeat protein
MVTNGLGPADVGGAWSTVGAATAFSVSPGAAAYRLAAGTQLTGFLPSAPRTDADVLTGVSLNAVPVGGALYLTVNGRRVSSGNEYNAKMLINADRSVTIRVSRLVGNAETMLAGPIKIAGLTYAAGMVLNVRLQVTGTSPTTVRARAWAASGSEPTSWQVSGTDATAALQVAGPVGLTAYMSAAVTPSPIVVSFSSLTAKPTAAPANQPPAAAFTFSCTALSCAFDGSGSSDDEGVASWSWTFGDGSSDVGPTPSHAYASGSTYTVALTVSDADGATNSVSKPVTVSTAPAKPPFVSDTFNRTVPNGLGAADVGGAWSTVGSVTSFSVAPGAAAFRMATAGSQLTGFLPSAPRTDADVLAAVALDKVPVGGPVYVTVAGRRISSGNEYNAKLVINADRSVTLRVSRLVGGAETALGGPLKITGITYAAATVLNVRLQVTGTSPTTVRARVWVASGAEPGTWQVTGTDTTTSLQAAGVVGLTTYLSSTATNAPVTARLSALTAKPTAA